MIADLIYKNEQRSSNTLVLMQTNGGTEDTLERNWSWLMKGGCDVLVTFPEDDPCRKFRGVALGKVIASPPSDFWRLQHRTLLAFEALLADEEIRKTYSDVMLLHQDCLFVGKARAKQREGLETMIIDYPNERERFAVPLLYHPPWWLDWATMTKFVEAARKEPMDWQFGYMDRWFPAVCQKHGVPAYQTGIIDYYCLFISATDRVEEARQSILKGYPLVHGVKTKEELEWVEQVVKSRS